MKMQSADDSAMLREYADNNSEEAFSALVRRYTNLVYSVALRHAGNPHSAEETTQAVFIILARKAAQLRHERALSSWLFQVARLTAINFVRGEARRRQREQEAHMQSILDESGDETWRKVAPLLDTAVGSLHEKDRRAIVLRYYEDRNLREVGLALGASEDAAEKRVKRALEKLRRFFTRRGITLSAEAIAGATAGNAVHAAPGELAKTITTAAFAKGAAAGESTLALVKGVLKIMAWTKAKLAVVTCAVMLLAVGTIIVAEKQPEGKEFKGTLKEVFPIGHQTNMFEFRLLSRPPRWELSLVSTDRRHQVFASPQQTFEVDLYDTPPTGPLNTAFIQIFPGGRPLSDLPAEHVWLALLSGNTFLGRQLPLSDPGLDMAEPSAITQVVGTLRDASPRMMRWTNEFPGSRSNRIEGEFKWTASTNLPGGLHLPTASQMAAYIVHPDGDRVLVNFSELVIGSVRPSNLKPIQIPRIPGRNYVQDYRMGDFLKTGAYSFPKPYDVFNGKGLEKAPSNSSR